MSGTTIVELHLPSDIMAALRSRQRMPLDDEDRVKLSLAIGLYADGTISLAKAAGLAGMSRYEFAMFLKGRGVAAYEYTEQDYQEDRAFLDSMAER
jgi:predicted HTH domain antitoxin